MDRRLTIAVAFAFLWVCAPLFAQNHPLTQRQATLFTTDRVISPIPNPYFSTSPVAGTAVGPPQAVRSMVRLPMPSSPSENSGRHRDQFAIPTAPSRLPQAVPPVAKVERLPNRGPTADPRLISTSRTSDDADPSRQAKRRRYPSTERIARQRPEYDVTAPKTYRWDPRDPNLVAVGNRAEKRIEAGFSLANKGALYGARAEFRKAILTVAEALDAQHGVTGHSQAMHAALQAIKEAAEFSPDESGSPGRVEQIVGTHQTPVLKQGPVKDMPALIAMQQYYAFAQLRMVAASGGAPVASKAMYAMGKLHMAMADANGKNKLDAAKAMTFLQAAIMVDTNNFAAAHELGVMLARFGHLREAREFLRHSARVQPMQETWKNLEVVHRRLGEDQLAQRASLEWQRHMPSGPPVVAGNPGTVHWVAPEAFAGHPSGTIPQPPVAPPMTAQKPTGFSLWPWR